MYQQGHCLAEQKLHLTVWYEAWCVFLLIWNVQVGLCCFHQVGWFGSKFRFPAWFNLRNVGRLGWKPKFWEQFENHQRWNQRCYSSDTDKTSDISSPVRFRAITSVFSEVWEMWQYGSVPDMWHWMNWLGNHPSTYQSFVVLNIHPQSLKEYSSSSGLKAQQTIRWNSWMLIFIKVTLDYVLEVLLFQLISLLFHMSKSQFKSLLHFGKLILAELLEI